MPVPARSKISGTGKQPAKEKKDDVKKAPTRKTGKEAAKKAQAYQKPVLPAKEESSQYSYVEDDEEEESESDQEVDTATKPTSTTTPSKPAQSKAGAKSKATKVAPLAAASSKKLGEAQACRQKMESMAKLYEAQAAFMRSNLD